MQRRIVGRTDAEIAEVLERVTAAGRAEYWQWGRWSPEDNEKSRRFGISIGHKDSDNLIRRNQVRLNQEAGVYFRNESEAMAGHRNRLEENVIENNGVAKEAPGIRVRGQTKDLQFRGNVIRDTRSEGEQRQKVGVLIEEEAGTVALDNNVIDAKTTVEDRRKARR